MEFDAIIIFVFGWLTGLVSDLVRDYITERRHERRDIRQKRIEKAYDPLLIIVNKYKVKLRLKESVKDVISLLENFDEELGNIPISLLLRASYDKVLETCNEIRNIREKIYLGELESLNEIKESLIALIDELERNVKDDFYFEEKDCERSMPKQPSV